MHYSKYYMCIHIRNFIVKPNMPAHKTSVFNNSCLNVPRNPNATIYPLSRYERDCLETPSSSANKDELPSEERVPRVFLDSHQAHRKSLLEFYASIPDYDDVHHLSSREFQRRLNALKHRQQQNCLYLKEHPPVATRREKWLRFTDFQQDPSKQRRSTSTTKCVRIVDTPKDWLNTSFGSLVPWCVQSEPSSPRKLRAAICNETAFADTTASTSRKSNIDIGGGPTTFRAHPVPIESQILLFDKIMDEQKLKNQAVRDESRTRLLSKMRPFSFTRRDEQLQTITRQLSKSTPNLLTEPEPTTKHFKPFRAKPIPKHIFSNYIYRRMYEDEYYRAIQRKVRAEEMLKAASLPPSMAKREKHQSGKKLTVCPRSLRRTEPSNTDDFYRNWWLQHNQHQQQQRFHQMTATVSPVSRSNMAAMLRRCATQQKLQNDIADRLAELNRQQLMHNREARMRRKPIWWHLDYSHGEELAMRLDMRREEACLRDANHTFNMRQMRHRVETKPTLYEQQSQQTITSTKYPNVRFKMNTE